MTQPPRLVIRAVLSGSMQQDPLMFSREMVFRAGVSYFVSVLLNQQKSPFAREVSRKLSLPIGIMERICVPAGREPEGGAADRAAECKAADRKMDVEPAGSGGDPAGAVET